MDINSLIANYLKNTNNTEVNASQIKDTFYNLASEDLQFCDSIFVYGEDATKDELIEYMSKACGKDDDQFKEDVGLLFDVLNSNSDDDVLTSDELESFTRQRGDNQGKIDGFGIWNELLNTDVSKIESEMAGSELSDLAQDIVDSGDVEGELAAYAAYYGEDSAEYKAIEEQVELAQSDSADSADSADGEGRSEEDINRMAQSIVDGKTTLEKIKSIGLLTDEEIAQLEDAVKTLEEGGELTTTEEATTPDATTPDATTPDATTPDATTPDATTPDATTPDATTPDATTPDATTSDATTPDATTPEAVSTEAKIPDDAAQNYAKELLNGVVSSSPEKIREYLDLDSADLVKVLSVYSNDMGYGSITKAIEGGLSEYLTKEEREEFINTVMSACIEQAKNGNEEAIGILCNEIYSATAQTWGYTGYTVLDSFFSNADNDVITLVKDNYSKHVEGHELRDDINGEAMWFHQDKKTSYIAKIDKSWQEET